MSQVFVGDIGTVIQLETGVDISTATTVSIKVKKRSAKHEISLADWVGTVESNTKVKYTSVSGDFNVAGTYRLQAYVKMSTWEGHGGIVELPVLDTV